MSTAVIFWEAGRDPKEFFDVDISDVPPIELGFRNTHIKDDYWWLD